MERGNAQQKGDSKRFSEKGVFRKILLEVLEALFEHKGLDTLWGLTGG